MSLAELNNVISWFKSRPFSKNSRLEEMRIAYEEIGSLFPMPTDAILEKVNANGVEGELILASGANERSIIIYFHGGGYAIGSLNTHRTLAYNLSKASRFGVLLVDYRLAPEHPFPAAIEDSISIYRWLRQNGLSAAQIGIAGDSAGGGLALATCLALRDFGEQLPGAVVCISAWTDLNAQGKSLQTKADIDPIGSLFLIEFFRNLYVKQADFCHPLVSPLYADLAGLPPLLLQVGSNEILLDDSTRLADLAKKAGVQVKLKIWKEMIHVWHLFAPILSEGQEVIDEAANFFCEHLNSY